MTGKKNALVALELFDDLVGSDPWERARIIQYLQELEKMIDRLNWAIMELMDKGIRTVKPNPDPNGLTDMLPVFHEQERIDQLTAVRQQLEKSWREWKKILG